MRQTADVADARRFGEPFDDACPFSLLPFVPMSFRPLDAPQTEASRPFESVTRKNFRGDR